MLVLEAEGVGAGQSAGLARIFRIAHSDPRLCALALDAERGWRRWERELGPRLLGDEGLVAAGPERAESYAAAMDAAGAAARALDRAAIAERSRLADHPWDSGSSIRSPAACASAARSALARAVTVRSATVVAVVGRSGDRAPRRRRHAERRAVLVCAGPRHAARWSRRSGSTSASRRAITSA